MALRLRASIEIRAPAAVVFGLVCTPERLPEWNVSVASARRLDATSEIRLGSRAVMNGKLLGQSLESETEVVRFEPPRAFATQACRGPKLLTQFEVESLAYGSRVLIDVSGEVPGGRVGAKLAEGFLKRELTASLERLRALSERESREHAAGTPAEGGDPACWLHLSQPDDG